MNKKILLLIQIVLVLPSVLLSNDLALPGVPKSWVAIQQSNLSMLPWEEDEWSSDDYYYCINRLANELLSPLPPRKRRSAFKIHNQAVSTQAESVKKINKPIVKDLTTWSDLDFFSSKDVHASYVADSLLRTATELGKVHAYYELSSVTDDKEMLLKRQAIIKALLENKKLLSVLRNKFNQLAADESALLSFWTNDWFLQPTKRNYFSIAGLSKLNSSKSFLLAKNIVDHGTRITNFCSMLLATVSLGSYAVAEMCSVDSYATWLEPHANRRKLGGFVADFLWDKGYKPLRAGIAAVGAVYLASQIQDNAQWVYDNFYLEQRLHERLQRLAQYFELLREINTYVQDASVQAVMPDLADLNSLFDAKQEPLRYAFMELLKDENLQDGPSLLADKGAVLLAYKMMYQLKDLCTTALKAASKLEAYVGFAALYEEYVEKNYPISFVQYVDSQESVCGMSDFIHPLIPPAEAVANSLHFLGAESPRTAIITGPNAGGKSTVIKAYMVNVLLGQSIGMVLARQAYWKPFSCIGTYLNITDDIQKKRSLFRAEVVRTHEMLDELKDVPEGQVSLFAFDEIFNGTTPREGVAAAYSVAKYLAGQKSVVALIATHFEALTELEGNTGLTLNYQVSASVNERGEIYYPFKLERGISHQHIALDILRSEGVHSSIVDDAVNFLRAKA